MPSSSNSQAVLYIPADQLEFTVADIPAMLAEARWPHIQGQCVAYALRLDAPLTRGQTLSAQDIDTLSAIWLKANLPEPDFPISVDDWQRYVDAFNASDRKPGWDLWQCLQSSGLDNGMRRAAAQSGYEASLREAIRSGEISARDPLTGRPVPPSDVRAQFNPDHLVLSRNDLVRFAADSLIEVRTQGDEPSGSGVVSSPDTSPATTQNDAPPAPYQNTRDWWAEHQLAELKKSGTRAVDITADLLLQRLAPLVGQGNCFSAADPQRKWIEYTNEDGEKKKWNSSAIREWLHRRRYGPRKSGASEG